MKATGIFILAAAPVKVIKRKNFLPQHEIIADQNAGDGAEKAGVANKPGKNVAAIARQQLPGLHEQAHNGGDHAAGTKTDAARGKIGEVVGGRDDVGGDVDIERGHEQADHGEHHGPGMAEARPEKKNQADEEQEGRGDALQEADGLDAPQDDEDIEKPEEHKAAGWARVDLGPARSEGHDHGVDGFAANPGLNAKPAASDQSSENRGNIRAECTERSAGKNGKRDAVLRAGVRVEQHGDQHEDVAEKNGEKRLFPAHAAGNHSAGEHVGRDVDAHGDPQSGVVVGTPEAALGTNRREVLVVERARFDDVRVKRLAVRFAHSKP